MVANRSGSNQRPCELKQLFPLTSRPLLLQHENAKYGTPRQEELGSYQDYEYEDQEIPLTKIEKRNGDVMPSKCKLNIEIYHIIPPRM